jgi:hypothetical protein
MVFIIFWRFEIDSLLSSVLLLPSKRRSSRDALPKTSLTEELMAFSIWLSAL